jgi:hypothetical protein
MRPALSVTMDTNSPDPYRATFPLSFAITM